MITDEDIGKLVAYYDEGWRHGRIEEVTKTTVWIKPTSLYGNPRAVAIGAEDVRIIDEQ